MNPLDTKQIQHRIFSGYASITGPSRRRFPTDKTPANWTRMTRVVWEHAGCVRRNDIEHLRSYSNSVLTSCVNDEELPPESGEQLCRLIDLTGTVNAPVPQHQPVPVNAPVAIRQSVQGANLLSTPAPAIDASSSAINLASLSSTFDDYINNPQTFDVSQLMGS